MSIPYSAKKQQAALAFLLFPRLPGVGVRQPALPAGWAAGASKHSSDMAVVSQTPSFLMIH